jgi:phage-related protein
MPGVGPGVIELRIHGLTEHRVFYIAKFAEAIYVLHAFKKKTRKTARADIEIGRRRMKEVLRWRRERGG